MTGVRQTAGRAEQSPTGTPSTTVLQATRGDQPFVGSQPSGDHSAAKITERSTAESPKPPTDPHIAEQRVSDERRAAQASPAKPTAAVAVEKSTPAVAVEKLTPAVAVEKLTPAAPAKLTTAAAVDKPAKTPSRLSSYQAEAAKLLAEAMTGRRKRHVIPEVPVADPVAEDQADQASRPAKKGQSKKD